MLTTFVIALREFLEAFLIVGVFLGVSRKLKLKREKEIILAAIVGIAISLLLPILTFMVGDQAKMVLTVRNSELLEGYLLIFSGFFIAYVVFSLHTFFRQKRAPDIIKAHQKLKENIFDLSLFGMIVFFVIREGFEIALFTATTSLFSTFIENFVGLVAGFAISAVFGLLTYFAYVKFPIAKIFKITEYMIILLGAAMVKNGFNELAEVYFDIHLSRLGPISLSFLPAKATFLGHFIKNMFGLEQGFSLSKLAIMGIYITVVYFVLLRKRHVYSQV